MSLVGWFQLYKRTDLFLYIFFILLFPCFDEYDVASESEKYNWSWTGWFLFIVSLSLQSASKLLTSDSETAFLRFENLFRVICLRLLKIFLFIVWRFVRIYPIVCLCGVITRSYASLFISQLCSTIVCLFPKLFIRFRMKAARFLLVILIS